MKRILLSTLALSALLISGCAVKTGNEKLANMEKSQIDNQIIKGKSTKSDVVAIMGDPDRTDFDNNGNEKWVYSHTRKAAKAINYVPVASWFVAGTNDTTKTLTILFADNGIVKNYTNATAEGETKAGLFQ